MKKKTQKTSFSLPVIRILEQIQCSCHTKIIYSNVFWACFPRLKDSI